MLTDMQQKKKKKCPNLHKLTQNFAEIPNMKAEEMKCKNEGRGGVIPTTDLPVALH